VFGDVTFAQAPFASLGGNTFAVSVSDAATASELSEAPSVIRGKRVDEGATAQDAQSVIATMVATQAETAAAADAQSVIATMVANALEQAGAAAAQTAIGTFLAAQAESTTGTATQTAAGTVLAAQAEAATGADSSNRGLLVSVAIAESATGTTAQVAQLSVNVSIAEAVSALSTLGVVKEANVYPTGVQLYINIGGELVWATIDTDQSPGWTQLPS
jgi:hypothetical protein